MYDVIVIGAGVIGSMIARDLSKYNLNVLVLEKENDVASGTSGANSAILHSGYDPLPNTLKAKLNVIGNAMFDEICEDLDVEILRNGSLTIARNPEEEGIIKNLYNRAIENKVNAKIISREEVLELEPNITKDVIGALYAKDAGIINPFMLCVGLMENAIDNGVTLRLNSEVINIENKDHYFVYTKSEVYTSKIIINCAGLYADDVNNMINEEKMTLKPRRGEYLVLDHFDNNFVKHVIFTVPSSKGKGVLITPTTAYNYLIGPSSNFVDDKSDVSTSHEVLEEVKLKANMIIDNIPYKHVIKQFSGNRAVSSSDDFIINEAKPGFINVAGIQSPGLVASPAISLEVLNILKNLIKLEEKPNYIKKRRKQINFNLSSTEDKVALIKSNKEYGNIICRCEVVTEAEVKDAIRRNCGARSVKGVKIRTRAGFGKCQGGFCQSRVVKLLAEELNIDISEVDYDKLGSSILKKMGD